MRDADDVEPAGGDVGGAEHLHVVALKQVERALALALRFVAVYRLGLDAALDQIFREPLHPVLGAAKDEHFVEAGFYKQVVQNIELVFACGYAHDVLVDVGGGLLRFDRDADGVAEKLTDEALDFGAERRREKERVARRRQEREDFAHVGDSRIYILTNDDELKQITKELNEKGYRNKQGSMFSLTFVSRLVRNKKYIGYISHVIEAKDLIPEVIDQETFDVVQDKLSPHKRKPAQHKAPLLYYLSGKIYCGNCGNLVTADSGTSNTGTIYRYYKCSNRKKNKHACNKKMIGKELLENEVINKTVEEIFKPELLQEIAENVVKTFNNEIKDDYQVKSYQNQIDDVSKKIENIMKAIKEGIITSTTKEKLLAYESLKADLLEQIATAKNKSIKPLETSEVMAFLKGFAELDYSKEENRTRLLEMFVHKIYLYDDYALIAYKGTNNPALELKLEHKKTERELLFEFGSIGAP